MIVWVVVLFVGGVAGLVAGAEGLVRGAAGIAARTGLSSVVIGLTVVSFGTSAPELAVSMNSALRGSVDLAVGNVVGSNIANVLLVLGLSALLGGALVVTRRLVRVDIPVMIGVSGLLWVCSLNDLISRWEGIALMLCFVAYVGWTVTEQRRSGERPDVLPDELEGSARRPMWQNGALVAGGLVLLVAGSSALVEAATRVASTLGVSDLVIGLTVVAVGTSLPELATSVLAAIRGERDLAVGNAVGSNIFNILLVLGATATLSPRSIPVSPSAVSRDIPIMVVVALATLPIFAIGYRLARWEGAVFVMYYAVYVGWLVISATADHLASDYAVTVLGFIVPLTALTFGVIGFRYYRRGADEPAVS